MSTEFDLLWYLAGAEEDIQVQEVFDYNNRGNPDGNGTLWIYKSSFFPYDFLPLIYDNTHEAFSYSC